MLQPFKRNDLKERKMRNLALPLMHNIGLELDKFFNGAYQAYPLGDALYDSKRDPMADVISKETYRVSFFAIHKLFTRPGTFEFYLGVFRAIFGPDIEIEFIVPIPGKLIINIKALTLELNDFLARRIEDNLYVYDEIIDHDGDTLQFQYGQSEKTQSETDALTFELSCGGVLVKANLTLV